jgi:hypothetical protein
VKSKDDVFRVTQNDTSNDPKNEWSYFIELTKDLNVINLKIKSDGNVPLYRYQRFNSHTIENLINDELFGTKPISFNDPYDSLPHVDFNKVVDTLRENNTLDSNIDREEQLKSLIDESRRAYNVVSLTSNIFNTAMWSHYADHATGFALQYDSETLEQLKKDYTDDFIEFFKFLHNLKTIDTKKYSRIFEDSVIFSPVIYHDKILDFSEENLANYDAVINIITSYDMDKIYDYYKDDYNYNLTKIQTLIALLTKNCYWSYEKEWRFCAIAMNKYASHELINARKIRPKAIYLGEFITFHNRYTIYTIAKTKNIKVFQMKTDYSNDTNRLIHFEISKKNINDFLKEYS